MSIAVSIEMTVLEQVHYYMTLFVLLLAYVTETCCWNANQKFPIAPLLKNTNIVK